MFTVVWSCFHMVRIPLQVSLSLFSFFFQMFFDLKTWFDAQAVCEIFGGSLASIHNSGTNTFISGLSGYL